MECDEEAVILLRKLIRVVKCQAQGSRVGLHLNQWLYNAIAVSRMPKIGIDNVASLAVRPTIVASVLQLVHRLRRGIITHQVTTIVCHPDLVIPWVYRHPNRI